MCWCWCFLLFCVPRLGSRLGILSFHRRLHFMLIFISFTLLRQGVCVCTICKDSKLQCRGHGSSFPSHANEAMGLSRKGVWTDIPVPTILYIVLSRPWAHRSRSWGGTSIFLSLLLYIVIDSCDYTFDTHIYIYIYVCVHVCVSSCHLYVWMFCARPIRSTSQFAMTSLSKCVTHVGSSR